MICGDSSYGPEGLLAQCEARQQKYLFRLRQTVGVKQLVQTLEAQSGWKPAVNGWEGAEGRLQLTGWTAKRRVVVLRRKQKRRMEKESPHELGWPLLAEGDPAPVYEYQVLVTNLSEELLRLRARPSPPSPRKIAVGSFYTPDTLRGLWKHSNPNPCSRNWIFMRIGW